MRCGILDTYLGLFALQPAPHLGFAMTELVATWINLGLYKVKMSDLD